MQEGFPTDGTLLGPAAVVSDVEDEVGLFRVAGPALAAREGPALLRQVTLGPRVPVAEALLVAPQVPRQGETLAAVLAIVLSFRVAFSYRFGEQLCNII